MKRSGWRKRIKEACIAAQTYQPFFDSVIDTLAILMETRDLAQKDFEDNGSLPVIEYTNKNGISNPIKNPSMAVVLDCNAQALQYWRDLGLTSKSWKAINEGKEPEDTRDGLTKALADLGI
jgi:hypothetical protein